MPDLAITNFELEVPCGVIPGSSGGGLFVVEVLGSTNAPPVASRSLVG